ncbi:MAG: branched-chain amino acid ABC transporter permease [bacterium]
MAALIGVTPWALPDWYYRLTHIGMYAMICVGLSLLLGYAGQISLGHAAFFAVGAYTSSLLGVHFGWSPWIAMWAGVALTIIIALGVGFPSLRLHGHYLAMATLAFGEIIHKILNGWVGLTGGPAGLASGPKGMIPAWKIFNYEISIADDLGMFYFAWGWAFIGLVVALLVIHSRTGRALRAIHDGEEAANVLGVSTSMYKVKVFVLSAVYASIAGSVYAHINGFIDPGAFGVEHSILFIVIVIVGGMRSVWGAIIGALVMGLLPEFLAELENWRILIYGAVLLLIVMFIPQGIFLGVRDLAMWTWRKAVRRA